MFFFSLTSLSRLFHSYRDEPIGRWGETGVPRENHLTDPQAELGLSHMWPVRGSNLHQSQRRDDRMIKSAEFSDLTHSATGGGGGGALFNGDLYICYVCYRFLRLLKSRVISDPDQNRHNLTITFNKFYISTCIIKS